VYYESSDFLETADSDTLKQIARTRELTRKYYFSDYRDTEKRTSILRELLGGIGGNRHAFSLRLWKKYFFGK
jgi:maltose O-acetyltransferase